MQAEKTQIRQQYFDNLPLDFDRTAIVAPLKN